MFCARLGGFKSRGLCDSTRSARLSSEVNGLSSGLALLRGLAPVRLCGVPSGSSVACGGMFIDI